MDPMQPSSLLFSTDFGGADKTVSPEEGSKKRHFSCVGNGDVPSSTHGVCKQAPQSALSSLFAAVDVVTAAPLGKQGVTDVTGPSKPRAVRPRLEDMVLPSSAQADTPLRLLSPAKLASSRSSSAVSSPGSGYQPGAKRRHTGDASAVHVDIQQQQYHFHPGRVEGRAVTTSSRRKSLTDSARRGPMSFMRSMFHVPLLKAAQELGSAVTSVFSGRLSIENKQEITLQGETKVLFPAGCPGVDLVGEERSGGGGGGGGGVAGGDYDGSSDNEVMYSSSFSERAGAVERGGRAGGYSDDGGGDGSMDFPSISKVGRAGARSANGDGGSDDATNSVLIAKGDGGRSGSSSGDGSGIDTGDLIKTRCRSGVKVWVSIADRRGKKNEAPAMEDEPDSDGVSAAAPGFTEGKVEPKRVHARDNREEQDVVTKVPLEKIIDLFHLRLREAAVHCGISITSMKRICRDHNISRWPQRKMGPILRNIASLHQRFERAKSAEERAHLQCQLQEQHRLKEQVISDTIGGFSGCDEDSEEG